MADDDTSIKVSRQTRERLARLAAERGSTLKDLVEELAAATLTAGEIAERELRARDEQPGRICAAEVTGR